MTTNIVSNPYGYWPKFSSSGPLFNAKIYVGEPDLDPADIPLNQKQVTARQEGGTEVAIQQPIETSSGGVTQYQGAPVQITVDGDYSLLVLNNKDEQVYYSANDKSEAEQISFKPEIVENQYGDGIKVEFDVPGSVVYEAERYLITWDGKRQWQLANDGVAKNWNITAPGKVTFTSPVPAGVRIDSELYVPITSAPSINDSEFSHVFNTFNALKTFTGDLSAALRVQTQQHTSEGIGSAFYSKDGTTGIPNSGNEARFYDSAGQGWKLTGTIELSQLGALTNGSDSSAALVAASTVTNICLLDGINGPYNFTSTPSLPSGFTSLIAGQNAITGATNEEVNGRLIDGGVLEGMPYTPELGYSKIEIISGTLRQNAADRTQWDWIKDGQHEPLGVDDSVPATASGSVLTIPFLKTYTKVLSIVAGPDESLANAIGFTCGASVGLGTFEIKASVNQVLSVTFWYDGADWQWGYGPGQGGPGDFGVEVTSITFDSAHITINHDSINGTFAPNPSGYTQDGAVNPLPINVRSLALSTKSIFSVRDWTGGYTTTESTNMSYIYNKQFSGGVLMDGTSGSESYDLDKGNIWFIGIMVV